MDETFDYSKIDPLIRDVVRDLHAAGFATWSSCQGWTCADDIGGDGNPNAAGGHCRHSFISFDGGVLWKRRKAARLAGLYLYNGNTGLTALPDDDGMTDEDVFACNLSFPDRVRRMFADELPKVAAIEEFTTEELLAEMKRRGYR